MRYGGPMRKAKKILGMLFPDGSDGSKAASKKNAAGAGNDVPTSWQRELSVRS